MEVSIREGVKADLPSVIRLVKELAEYEREPDAVEVTLEEYEQHGFGEHPLFGFYVAEADGDIVGISLYYIRFSTWKGAVLYLEDIVVRETHRGAGIGAQLFERTMKLALDRGYRHMTWQVLDWNEPALNFYRKYNSELDGEWINGKLTAADISDFFARKNK